MGFQSCEDDGGNTQIPVIPQAEAAIPRTLLADILRLIAELRPPPLTSTA